jgi:hypothetical protein
MKTNKLISSITLAVAVLLGSVAFAPTAQAEAQVSFYHYNDGSVAIVYVLLTQDGDFVQSDIIDFAYAHGVAIMIDCAPGLFIEEVDGLITARAN